MTNQELDACKRDIEIIKSTIEKSKVNLGSISKLFIIYGVTDFILLASNLIVSGFHWYKNISVLFPIIQLAIFSFLLFLYIRNYANLKRSNNTYTLQLLRVWGIAMFLLPLFSIASTLATVFIQPSTFSDNMHVILLALPEFTGILMFMIALLFTGIVLNKKSMIIASLVLIVSVIPVYHFGACSADVSAPYTIYSYLRTRTLVYKLAELLGYIMMGIRLLPKKVNNYGLE